MPSGSPTRTCSNASRRCGLPRGTYDRHTWCATAAFTTMMNTRSSQMRFSCSRSRPPKSSRSPRATSATHVTSSDFRPESTFLPSKSPQDETKTSLIVLYCSRKHKFGHVSKQNKYWINISYPKDRRKTPNVLRILFTGFLRESEVDHEV